jgi:hypothetical protein
MLDNNNQNNGTCAFAGQIVSYLYGEAGAKEKTVFETHLNSCSVCADELAGFSMARSSILEWRNEEFLPLETPSIEIPHEKSRDFYIAEADSKVSRNWFSALHRVFSISPASPALIASASFAIVVICLGVILFANKSANNVGIAGFNGKNTEQLISSPKQSNENFNNVAQNNNTGKTSEAASPDKETKPLIAVAENNNRKTIPNSGITGKDLNIKISNVSRSPVKIQSRETNLSKIKPSTVENKKPVFAQTGKIPTLNNVEEDEDKSLRLAELFEDDDAK